MNIAIIDDEKIWRDKAHGLVEKHYNDIQVNVEEFESGNSFLEKRKKYDFVLMDVEMNGLNGFETLSEYRLLFDEFIAIIFTTHMETSAQGYLVNAFRYVNKTKMEEELEEALSSADIKLETNKFLTFHQLGKGEINIRIKDILYIETEWRNIVVHTSENQFKCSGTLSEYEQSLEYVGFFRCHNSYLVNLDRIKNFDTGAVYFANGEMAYISARKYAETKRRYLKRKRAVSSK